MFLRVVRFTNTSASQIDDLVKRINESEGPPPGVRSSGIKLLLDEAQGTAVVIQEFATAQDMEDGAKILGAMDASETPGTRASVDACELKLDMRS